MAAWLSNYVKALTLLLTPSVQKWSLPYLR